MNTYNLFPLLAGPLGSWRPHLERAAGMGFDWVFVNPIQQSGGTDKGTDNEQRKDKRDEL